MAVRVAVDVTGSDADLTDALKTQRIDEPPPASAKYVVVASLSDRLVSTNDNKPESPVTTPPPEDPPTLDLEKLQQEKKRSIVRRASVRRKLEDAPDSLRLESTRRRSSVGVKEPSRATVVYSPRALAELLTRKKAVTRSEWCSLM